jgi:hypothetical protein
VTRAALASDRKSAEPDIARPAVRLRNALPIDSAGGDDPASASANLTLSRLATLPDNFVATDGRQIKTRAYSFGLDDTQRVRLL